MPQEVFNIGPDAPQSYSWDSMNKNNHGGGKHKRMRVVDFVRTRNLLPRNETYQQIYQKENIHSLDAKFLDTHE